MKKCLVRLIMFFSLSVCYSVSAIATENYIFDPIHSFVVYHINHFGFSNLSGKWSFNGNVILDTVKPQNSKVNITIPLAQIDTDVPALNAHLSGKLFFDVANYPNATFVSNKVTVTGRNTANVQGILTLHGYSHTVVLDVLLNKMDTNLVTEKKAVGFSAQTHIKRSDFGIITLLPEVGDDVNIDIEAEAGIAPAITPQKKIGLR
jgi:polyisoprenoid-binding protein YceI